jgi:hypothetical protein
MTGRISIQDPGERDPERHQGNGTPYRIRAVDNPGLAGQASKAEPSSYLWAGSGLGEPEPYMVPGNPYQPGPAEQELLRKLKPIRRSTASPTRTRSRAYQDRKDKTCPP